MTNDFRKEIDSISKSIKQKRSQAINEESTKLAFVLPFVKALGYNYSDPADVIPEYSADIRNKNMAKVDYAIMSNGKPIFFIECKHCGVENLMNHHGQLAPYFASAPVAKFAILTNGIRYLFFTDMEREHLLDPMPFLGVDLTDLEDIEVELLEMFCKDIFNSTTVFEAAIEARDKQRVKNVLEKELKDPSDEFVRFLISSFYLEKKNQQTIDRFRPYVRAAIADYISNTANITEDKSEVNITRENHPYSSAFTEVVKSILEQAGHSIKSFEVKAKEGYIDVRYRKCWVCIFNYDEHKLNIKDIQFIQPFIENGKLIDGKRNFTDTFNISSPNDIGKYADRIVAAAKDIDEYYHYRELSHKYKDNKGD